MHRCNAAERWWKKEELDCQWAYQDVCGSRAVQPAGGFIHEQHRGLGGDLTPDVDALALPAAAGNGNG
jgi:hypothetical protein